MGALTCINDYLKVYGPELGHRVVDQFPPLHRPSCADLEVRPRELQGPSSSWAYPVATISRWRGATSCRASGPLERNTRQ